MNMIQRLLFVTVLMFLVAPLAVHGTLVSDDKVTFDPALAVTNFNQFKTNIDSRFPSCYFNVDTLSYIKCNHFYFRGTRILD